MRTAEWLDRDEYPFESRYFDLEMGRMHHVDEGSGEPIVMVHGNPTWSYLYRHLIKQLSPDYRCVAMDHIGFGLSEKPPD
jgi:haloalkane dehalogenase